MDQLLIHKTSYCAHFLCFLGATKHLYNWLCPSVGRSVGWLVGWSVCNAFVRRSTHRTLLAYLALLLLQLDWNTPRSQTLHNHNHSWPCFLTFTVGLKCLWSMIINPRKRLDQREQNPGRVWVCCLWRNLKCLLIDDILNWNKIPQTKKTPLPTK